MAEFNEFSGMSRETAPICRISQDKCTPEKRLRIVDQAVDVLA
jgi:hypothetical protein